MPYVFSLILYILFSIILTLFKVTEFKKDQPIYLHKHEKIIIWSRYIYEESNTDFILQYFFHLCVKVIPTLSEVNIWYQVNQLHEL